MKKHVWHTALTVLGAVTFTVLFTLSFQALADQLASTNPVPRLIPYNGNLSLDGEPISGSRWLKFEVLDNSPVEGQAVGQVVYSQTLQADVHDGRFTVFLGPEDDSGIALDVIITGADELVLQTTVLGDHNPDDPASTAGDDVTLSNPQRLLMSPFSMWATNAADFDVADTRDPNFEGNRSSLSSISVEGDTHIQGSLTLHHLDSERLTVDNVNLERGIAFGFRGNRENKIFKTPWFATGAAASGSLQNGSPGEELNPTPPEGEFLSSEDYICALQSISASGGGGAADAPPAQALLQGFETGCHVGNSVDVLVHGQDPANLSVTCSADCLIIYSKIRR